MGKELSLRFQYAISYLYCYSFVSACEGICNVRKIIFASPVIRRKQLKLPTSDTKRGEVHLFAADTLIYLNPSWDTVWTSNSTWLWKRKRFLDWAGRNFPQMLSYWNDDMSRFTKCFFRCRLKRSASMSQGHHADKPNLKLLQTLSVRVANAVVSLSELFIATCN